MKHISARAQSCLKWLLVSWEDWPDLQHWYLREFIPQIVKEGELAGRDDNERRIIRELQKALEPNQWTALSGLVEDAVAQFKDSLEVTWQNADLNRQRRAAAKADWEQRLKEIEEEERRREAEAEQRRLEIEHERDAQRRAAQQAEIERRQREEKHQAEERRIRQLRESLLAGLREAFDADFLNARQWLTDHDPDGLVGSALFEYEAANYVRKWFATNPIHIGNSSEPYAPNDEQAAAIAAVDAHILVAARAGSGKTTSMVARAYFLTQACGVSPDEILMLAFNRDAANQIRETLEVLLKGTPPHAMTFHALAYRLVHPPEALIYDEDDHRKAQSRHLQRLIDGWLKEPQRQSRVRDVMLGYYRKDWSRDEFIQLFREDWERIVRRGDNLSSREQIAYRRHLEDETLRGEFVKSYGEKVIANTLFEHAFEYGYEHDVRWNGTNYKPDFSIYDRDKMRRVVVEYFGRKGEPEYDEQADEKRTFWRTKHPDVVFLEYFPADAASGSLPDRLLKDLRTAGATPVRLPDDELWEKIKDRAVDRFTEAAKQFIERARHRRWSGGDLRAKWSHIADDDETLSAFVELCADLLDTYNASLNEGYEDFTGLIWRAADAVASGQVEFGRAGQTDGNLRALRFIVVDEFQDFSLMFHTLLQSVLEAAPNATVMAVGDDWQAINEFAGSTLEYFTDFEASFPDARRLSLTTNRRSTPRVVAVGNAVMDGNGKPARPLQGAAGKSLIRSFDLEQFYPSPRERIAFGDYDRTTPMLLRLLAGHLREGRTVAVLSRTKRLTHTVSLNGVNHSFKRLEEFGVFLNEILGVEDQATVRYSTVHGFKGQEADAVVLLEVTERNYPKIHPTWILFRVFGDDPKKLTEAERLLFYVGVSRPRTHLDVLTRSRNPSTFWADVLSGAQNLISTGHWDEVPRWSNRASADLIEVRVKISGIAHSNVFHSVVSKIKASGISRFQHDQKFWWTTYPSDQFDWNRLLRSDWASVPGVRIEALRGDRVIHEHGAAVPRRLSGPTPW